MTDNEVIETHGQLVNKALDIITQELPYSSSGEYDPNSSQTLKDAARRERRETAHQILQAMFRNGITLIRKDEPFTEEEAIELDFWMNEHMCGHSISNSYHNFTCNPGCRTDALRRGVNKILKKREEVSNADVT